MFKISVKSDLQNLQKQLSNLERKTYPQALARTLNRVAESSKVASAKHIAPLMNTKQSYVKRNIPIEKAHRSKLWATIRAIGKPLKLIAFKARQTAKGVVSKAWGVSKLYRGTFIAPIRHGSSSNTVYSRKTKHSLPVKALYGPGIAQLFKKPDNIQLMMATVKQRLATEFKNNLQFYARRLMK